MTRASGERPRPPARPAPGAVVPNIVEHRTFRRRRLVDAACALPLLGWILWWLPLFWVGAERAIPASTALIYIFGIWLCLALCAARLIQLIARDRPTDSQDGPEERA